MTGRFPIRTRVLHWQTAVADFAALLNGFTMTNQIGSHAALVAVHMTLGISILVIVIVRAANRFTHKPPKSPACKGRIDSVTSSSFERSDNLRLSSTLPVYGFTLVHSYNSGQLPLRPHTRTWL